MGLSNGERHPKSRVLLNRIISRAVSLVTEPPIARFATRRKSVFAETYNPEDDEEEDGVKVRCRAQSSPSNHSVPFNDIPFLLPASASLDRVARGNDVAR